MSIWRESAAAVLALAGACLAASAQPVDFAGIGRPATPAEVGAWDIDVRPDFKGLPAGSGSVAAGQMLWEGKCASCHGVFGESGEVFHPLVGGTTADDVRTGRVARLTDTSYPGRTTLMKLATLSSLWDYIHRAMPWAEPKSLNADEVYAATAYLLHLGGVLPADFVLSDANIRDVQQRLPNRDGMGAAHALWPDSGAGRTRRPDVQGTSCIADCAAVSAVASALPEHARDAHGNLAAQNRLVGAQLGADTYRPAVPGVHAGLAARIAAVAATRVGAGAPTPPAMNGSAASTSASATPGPGAALLQAPAPATTLLQAPAAATALLQAHGCMACHGMVNRVVGPGLQEIARKYADRPDAAGHLAGRIRSGGSGVWGATPMPAQNLSDADARAIAQWLARGAAH